MKVAQLPENEIARLEALKSYGILDTAPEAEFDDLVKLAAQICDVPITLVSLIDTDRQWFKAKVGLEADETHRDMAFCAHAILNDEIFIVEDATKDERFFDNPLVAGNPDIRFYAGMPLKTPSNFNLGTLCVIDQKPRQLNDAQKFALTTLGHQVIKLLEHKIKIEQIEAQKAQLSALNQQKDQVMKIVLHDLYEPLQSLEMTLSVFSQEDLSGDEFKYMFKDAEKSIRSANHLLENIAYWANLQLKNQSLSFSNFQLKSLVNNELSIIDKIAEEKNITFKNEINSIETLNSDENVVKLILRSLFFNALKRTRSGNISIQFVKSESQVEILVQDNGKILDTNQINILLDYANNNQVILTDDFKELGTSLVLAQELAKLIKGQIQSQAQAIHGMIFKLVIEL